MLVGIVDDGRRFHLEDFTISYTQNQAEVATVSFFVTRIDNMLDLYLRSIHIYNNETFIWSGLLFQRSAFDSSSDTIRVTYQALGWLAQLSTFPSKASSLYVNTPLTVLIGDVLATTTGWSIGSTATLEQPNYEATIDLRKKTNAFGQIAESLKTYPNVFMRYGGFDGSHRLDVGLLNDVSYVITSDMFVEPPQIIEADQPVLKGIKAFGGYVKEDYFSVIKETKLNLGVAARTQYNMWSDFPVDLMLEPDFPIIVDDAGDYIVINNAVERGLIETRFYDIIKADDTTYDWYDVNIMGLSLYHRAKRDLIATQPANVLKAKIACTLDSLPNISQIVKPYFKINSTQFNPIRYELLQDNIFDFEGTEFRITSMSISYDPLLTQVREGFQDILIVDIEASDSWYGMADTLDLEQADRNDVSYIDVLETVKYLSKLEVEVTHSGVAPDATLSGTLNGYTFSTPIPAKEFSFPMGTPPVDATAVYGVYQVLVGDNVFVYENVVPEVTPTDAMIYVSGEGVSDWTTSSNITVKCTYYFLE